MGPGAGLNGWKISSPPGFDPGMHRPHFVPEKDPVSILQEAGWASGLVWVGGKSRPHRDSIPDFPAYSQSLYRLSYPAHLTIKWHSIIMQITFSSMSL